jgi:hypothetical protein
MSARASHTATHVRKHLIMRTCAASHHPNSRWLRRCSPGPCWVRVYTLLARNRCVIAPGGDGGAVECGTSASPTSQVAGKQRCRRPGSHRRFHPDCRLLASAGPTRLSSRASANRANSRCQIAAGPRQGCICGTVQSRRQASSPYTVRIRRRFLWDMQDVANPVMLSKGKDHLGAVRADALRNDCSLLGTVVMTAR